EQQPFVEAAQAAQLSSRGAGVDSVRAKMLEEGRYIVLRGAEQNAMTAFEELGKRAQIAEIGLSGERPQASFHAQVDLVILQKRKIGGRAHTSDYGLSVAGAAACGQVTEPHSSRNQGLQ